MAGDYGFSLSVNGSDCNSANGLHCGNDKLFYFEKGAVLLS